VPAVDGVPPKEENKLNEDPELQELAVPLVPALTGLTTVTVVEAEPVQPHELVADKVYV
jgi:hypothetical protein